MTLALLGSTVAGAAPSARVIDVNGIIGPATATFVARQLDAAVRAGDTIVVLRMDTPGGLDSAMREIIRAILASPVPVATFVHPEGARAASAGTFILYASHVAAMAPATNLGAATPVAIGLSPGGDDTGTPAGKRDPDEGKRADAAPATGGSAMSRKAVNDASAYLRSLAELRGRDIDFAERAVREAAWRALTRDGAVVHVADDGDSAWTLVDAPLVPPPKIEICRNTPTKESSEAVGGSGQERQFLVALVVELGRSSVVAHHSPHRRFPLLYGRRSLGHFVISSRLCWSHSATRGRKNSIACS